MRFFPIHLQAGCLLLLFAAACTVPTLEVMGERACDLDAGRDCIQGYLCVDGVCRVPQHGSCTPGEERACGSTEGECREGLQICGPDGSWGECEGAAHPTDELCDGKDNDCDGDVDIGEDGLSLRSDELCELQEGVCAGARRVCVDGAFETPCTATSYGANYEEIETRCDGLDNSCDGNSDADPLGLTLRSEEPCEIQEGVCAGARRACVDGAFETPCTAISYGEDYEEIETRCDGRDNSCDGVTDNGPLGLPLRSEEPCASQEGVCAGARRACVHGAFETPCTAISYGEDYEEIETRCDGRDNSCDGVTDRNPLGLPLRSESLCGYQDGVCEGARPICMDGAWDSPCTEASYGPDYQPVELVCDGRDLDCDGRVDASRAVTLVAGGWNERLSLAIHGDTLTAVYSTTVSGATSVHLLRMDRSMSATAPVLRLSPVGVSARMPALTGGDFGMIAAWVERHGEDERLMVAGFTPDGTESFRTIVAEPVAPAFFGLRLAAYTSEVAIAWVDAPTAVLMTAKVDLEGDLTAPAAAFTEEPIGMVFIEQVFDADVAATEDGLVVAWTSLRDNVFRARFAPMEDGATTRDYSTTGVPSSVRLISSGIFGLQAGWIERDEFEPMDWRVRWTLNPLTEEPAMVVPGSADPEIIISLAAIGTPRGPVVAWSLMGPPSEIPAWSSADGMADLVPPGEGDVGGPSLAAGGDCVWLGYEVQAGSESRLRGAVTCFCD